MATKTQTTEDEKQQQISIETQIIHDQQIATRIFLILFTYSLFIILLSTGLDTELHSVAINISTITI